MIESLAGVAAALIALEARDRQVRAELAAAGELDEGYHPRMRAVHETNADQLSAIIAEHGWPVSRLVGADAARSAFLVLQHAISRPKFMRAGLQLLRERAAAGDGPWVEVAMLTDRILVFEGKPQLYGTQFDWDDHGEMSPYPIVDCAEADRLRHAAGMETLAENIARIRSRLDPNAQPPSDLVARRAAANRWARENGWRDDPMNG